LLRKKECPNCRKEIRKWGCQKSELIDQAVDLVIQSKSSQGDTAEATRWQERKDNFKTWLEKHHVKNVKAGQIIDCLDTEHIWCPATVELKIQSERSKEPLILVHYEGWSRKYDELLNISSKRVAPKGLYTDR
jgi:hypothetical protein